MSARPTHDLSIRTGEYQDRETGQTKGRWLTIGTVFKHDDGGTSIKLDAVPVGLPEWNGWVSVFPRDKGNGQGQKGQGQQSQRGPQGQYQGQPPQDQGPRRPAPPPQQNFDDDIPF